MLAKLNWPFSSSSLSYSLHDRDEVKKSFSELFNLLLKLDPLSPPGEQGNRGKNMDDPLLYPMEQLVQPLRKRFRYHFVEERRTNSLEKVGGNYREFPLVRTSFGLPQPEWCFTQLSSWIRSHTPFLEKLVQPLLDAAGLSQVDVVVSSIWNYPLPLSLVHCN